MTLNWYECGTNAVTTNNLPMWVTGETDYSDDWNITYKVNSVYLTPCDEAIPVSYKLYVNTGSATQVTNQTYPVRWNSVEWNTDWQCAETGESRIAREEQQAKRDAAEKRAEELMLACLNDEQRAQFLAHGYFETTVNDKTYRINKGRSGNVQLMEEGRAKAKFCIHEEKQVPQYDTMLSQMLLLETDEAAFLRIANKTTLNP